MKARPWTAAETDELAERMSRDESVTAIALALNRSRPTIRKHIARLVELYDGGG